MSTLQNQDQKVYNAIKSEAKRQKEGIELIASENYVSSAVLEAMGSILTNKYSEGYSGKRYYAGNEYIDEIEDLAKERACKLFNAEHANVQVLPQISLYILLFWMPAIAHLGWHYLLVAISRMALKLA